MASFDTSCPVERRNLVTSWNSQLPALYRRPYDSNPSTNTGFPAATCGASYVARWTSLHIRRLTKSFSEAIHRKGFRLIEVITPCATLYSRLNRLGSGLDLMRFYHDNAEIRHGVDTRELDIGFQERIVCGKFIDEERPTFLEMKDAHYKEVLGDRYMPMGPEGGWLHE